MVTRRCADVVLASDVYHAGCVKEFIAYVVPPMTVKNKKIVKGAKRPWDYF